MRTTQELGPAAAVRGESHSPKDAKVRELARQFEGYGVDARFAGYFLLFNEGRYYEAHDVLESLWLPLRRTEEGDFYKGMIQLAGAFVHVQKRRPGPARALLRLAQANLGKYPMDHLGLEVGGIHALIEAWLKALHGVDVLPSGMDSGLGIEVPILTLPWRKAVPDVLSGRDGARV